MDSYTLFCNLKEILKASRIKKAYVIASDETKTLNFQDLPIVICQNNERKNENGAHWVSYFVYKKKSKVVVEFFDSLGKQPKDHGLEFPFPVNKYNPVKLQCNQSNVCSLYCIFFLWQRSKGVSFEMIQSFFSHD